LGSAEAELEGRENPGRIGFADTRYSLELRRRASEDRTDTPIDGL
jgi:hypothetical protein